MFKKIFLNLGRECNLNCKYCFEHKQYSGFKINEDIYQFLNIFRNTPIKFIGGEPLLHFDYIKTIVKHLPKNRFDIVTNGSLIDDEIVDFANDHNFMVAISYDGKNTMQSRNYDVTCNDNIYKLNNVAFKGVITSLNYPVELSESLEILRTKFEMHNRKKPPARMCLVHGNSLWYPNKERLYNDIVVLTKEFLAGKDTAGACFVGGTLNGIRRMGNPYDEKYNYCASGRTVLNMDIEGNIYNCAGAERLVTDIYHFDKLKTLPLNDECLKCPIIHMCRGGCKLDFNPQYCECQQTILKAITDTL